MSSSETLPFDKLEPLDPAHQFKDVSVSDDGKTLRAKTVHNTDWWRIPSRDAHDGPVLGVWKDVPDKGFEVQVDLEVHPVTQYDQVSLFLYFTPTQWCKASLEFDDDKLWIGPVVCNPFSDWSLSPSESNSAHFTLAYTPETQTLRVFHNQVMIREVHAFSPGQEQAKVFVGVMACSPKGDRAEVSWRNLAWKQGAREVH